MTCNFLIHALVFTINSLLGYICFCMCEGRNVYIWDSLLHAHQNDMFIFAHMDKAPNSGGITRWDKARLKISVCVCLTWPLAAMMTIPCYSTKCIPGTEELAELSSYPGYFREPHWLSVRLPEIFRLTWQVWIEIFVSSKMYLHTTFTLGGSYSVHICVIIGTYNTRCLLGTKTSIGPILL